MSTDHQSNQKDIDDRRYKTSNQNRTEHNSLEGAFKDHLVQLPDHFRAKQNLNHIIEGIIQMSLKHWQTWGINHVPRQPVVVFDHPLNKENFPNIYYEPFPMQFYAVPLCSVFGYQGGEIGTSLSISHRQEVVESNGPLSLLSFRLNYLNVLSLLNEEVACINPINTHPHKDTDI